MRAKGVKCSSSIFQILDNATPGEYDFSNENENYKIVAKKFRHQFVSEKVTIREIRRLNNRIAMLIRSQTGTGKSSLVFGTLLAEAKRLGLKVLVLVPRTALALQYKLEAIAVERPDIPEEYREYEAGKESCFGNIEVMTYQKAFFKLANGSIKPDHYAFVVMDECHYFVEDAAFDRNTERILTMCLSTFKSNRRIYLSATPELVLDSIIERECLQAKQSPMERNPSFFINRMGDPEFRIYDFESNYSYVRPTFFTDVGDIIKLIAEDESDCKTLICVDRKSTGKKLEAQLEDLAEYIDAELKNTTKAEDVLAMIHSEKFEKKVLIATSFMDVGINLKDEKLRRIVIFSTSLAHFKQSIGRKRRDDKDVFLYIYIPQVKRLNQMHGRISAELAKANETKKLFQNTSRASLTEIPFPIVGQLTEGKITCRANELTLKNLELRKKGIEEMLDVAEMAPSEEEGLARHFLGWLGLADLYPNCKWLGAKPDQKYEELVQLLEDYVGRDLTSEESTKFRAEILRIHNQLGTEEKWKTNRNLPYVDAINRFLTRSDIPFHVEAVNKCIRVMRGGDR